jgi:hypothetical protein
MVAQGLREAGERSAMLRENLSALLRSCIAQKAGGLPSVANPASLLPSYGNRIEMRLD